MEVILLQKVENLGNLGDKVKVKPGYGRNYLIPHGLATMATAANVAAFEARRAELERIAKESLDRALVRKAEVEGAGALSLSAKAGTEGKLFGSIGTVDIAEALAKRGISVERKELRLAHGPIRAVGEHEVEVHLHSDVSVMLKVTVTAEE
jgi:large subunit ribosomal protein L9